MGVVQLVQNEDNHHILESRDDETNRVGPFLSMGFEFKFLAIEQYIPHRLEENTLCQLVSVILTFSKMTYEHLLAHDIVGRSHT